MRKLMWTALLVVPLGVAGGLVFANSQTEKPQPASPVGYICPVTGEELPCPLCCPYSEQK